MRTVGIVGTLGTRAAILGVLAAVMAMSLVCRNACAGEPPSSSKTAGGATSPAAGTSSGSVSTGVQVRCATEKADIFIDGEQVGQTPLKEALALKSGEHTIRVARLGFTPYIDVFKVRAGQVTKLDVEIIPISGVLHVTAPSEPVAEPAGSPDGKGKHEPTAAVPGKGMVIRIFVDEKYLGQPPLETELAIGSHTVRIERGGYFPDRFTFNAVAGETVEHVADLKPLPPDQNPYAKKEPPPTKWYQKWWVWTLAAVGVAVIATAVIVPVVVTQNNSLCNNVDVCATASSLTQSAAASSASSAAAPAPVLMLRF